MLFLDERNEDAFFGAPKVFDELIQRLPLDADAHFWRGYVKCIHGRDDDQAKKALHRALELDRNHAYAQLALSAYDSGLPRIKLLERLLNSQPGNLRALESLASTLRDTGDRGGSRLAYQRIIDIEPYVELRYGIMNKYINGVLTGSYWAERYKREAAEQLA